MHVLSGLLLGSLKLELSEDAYSKLQIMCEEEGISEEEMLKQWVNGRWAALYPEDLDPEEILKTAESHPLVEQIDTSDCGLTLDPGVNAREIFAAPKAELACPELFIRAVIRFGDELVRNDQLLTFDILHEVIRADTGYRINRDNGRFVDTELYSAFLSFQLRVAEALPSWKLWEYEYTHWQYHQRPVVADEYQQLYNILRPPSSQHLECPSPALPYRMWSNFPTCPPTRFRDLFRMYDAAVSGLTVDNWRGQHQQFLSAGYSPNVSHFDGGDPTQRLSKGAHSIFAGVFIQKMPTDLWCYQQVLHDLRPDYIIDLGSSQGGSALWFAAQLKTFELHSSKVLTVDMPKEQAYWLNNDRAVAAAKRLRVDHFIDWNYVDGGSTNVAFREKVAKLCSSGKCMVVSDSNHDYEHTFYELEWFSKVVGVGQYMVVEDTNIYGWSGWTNINDPNEQMLRKGPMEAANDFEFAYDNFERTDWCSKHYGLSQTQNGWFFKTAAVTSVVARRRETTAL
mmetsp:Transcript_86754/g.198020  ORF Transcript_86754/g.198020 Transcript_86754/m.198020 type:complete len:510 (+) Transcript_86754:14-1543(+)